MNENKVLERLIDYLVFKYEWPTEFEGIHLSYTVGAIKKFQEEENFNPQSPSCPLNE